MGRVFKVEERSAIFKEKRRGKGRSTKSHTFLMGLLLTDTACVCPCPRRTWYHQGLLPQAIKKRVCVPRTTPDEADVETMPIPKDVQIIVLADEYFEGPVPTARAPP